VHPHSCLRQEDVGAGPHSCLRQEDVGAGPHSCLRQEDVGAGPHSCLRQEDVGAGPHSCLRQEYVGALLFCVNPPLVTLRSQRFEIISIETDSVRNSIHNNINPHLNCFFIVFLTEHGAMTVTPAAMDICGAEKNGKSLAHKDAPGTMILPMHIR